MVQYVGSAPLEGQTSDRYFYALRRDDDGQLFVAKLILQVLQIIYK